ncbi:MAG: FKBP-type peptidyl-prolyl cis-trans isomerase [Flavobacteriaceae bacterium]
MILRKLALLGSLTLILFSCASDDSADVVVVPPRMLSEVAAEDDAEIREYLQTHFYNYEEFQSPPVDFDFKIVIDTIAGNNAGKTPLINQVSSKQVTVTNDEFNLSDEESVAHTYYYFVAREGLNEQPTVADSVLVRYKGSLLDGFDFDGSFVNPIWFDLAAIQGPGQGARGFSEAIPNFKIGGDVIDNGDGTVTVDGYGVGAMFIPSGLAFFNAIQTEIPAYSPLIFTIDLFSFDTTDHDGDGIPSFLEDVDGDGYLYNDNTDLEQEQETTSLARFSDFLDADDDADGTPTRDEIEIDNEGNITFPDGDGDGVPDYRDRDNS